MVDLCDADGEKLPANYEAQYRAWRPEDTPTTLDTQTTTQQGQTNTQTPQTGTQPTHSNMDIPKVIATELPAAIIFMLSVYSASAIPASRRKIWRIYIINTKGKRDVHFGHGKAGRPIDISFKFQRFGWAGVRV